MRERVAELAGVRRRGRRRGARRGRPARDGRLEPRARGAAPHVRRRLVPRARHDASAGDPRPRGPARPRADALRRLARSPARRSRRARTPTTSGAGPRGRRAIRGDHGSRLGARGRWRSERGFRRCFAGEPTIGGRYSALSPFGIVPAALMGIDVDRLLAAAEETADACYRDADNPGYELGRRFGEGWREGRDKVCIAETGEGFGLWAEQLIAESTGKQGKGLVPAPGESPDGPDRQAGRAGAARPVRARRTSSSAGSSRSRSPPRISRSTRSTSPTSRRRRTRRTRCSRPGSEPELAAGGLDRRARRAGAARRLRLRPGVPRPERGERRAGSPTSSHGLRRADGSRRHARLRAALPPLDGPAAQGRPEHRPLSAGRRRPGRGAADPGPAVGFRRLIRAQAEGDFESLKERGRRVARIHADDL